jgi:hypothetical protein
MPHEASDTRIVCNPITIGRTLCHHWNIFAGIEARMLALDSDSVVMESLTIRGCSSVP